ncbi:G-protein coupled receptors family 1 profile domain-containing protein [Caenorhabditis elegans]|uniref:G-protein coupled receptors family 1 profile domain-containing protein n=1 Tax=Caenorhabditis elegans TaxID=6239 RepID=O16416_CAEEL|nr:G-protein coupled receptors family 1 profile domain-containing protein [Caenorhabditis elegans]CCD70831.1 G-protein coupled receptors family 1 profile domain-containing protein [Caenorhabditis elegans]|eukprot:NP_504144.2 Serpentine Receptor, class W [Caenorhabditis elegans]
MALCDQQFQYFYPNFQNKTAISLCQFQFKLIEIVSQISAYEYIASCVCFLINVVHILVLTRKSMRTSSINVIMTAVAIFDICSYLLNFGTLAVRIISSYSKCFNESSYQMIFLNNCLFFINEYARRCSTWLLFSVAVIRTLVIRNPMSPKYAKLSNSSTALRVIFGVSIICIIFSINTALENEIEIIDRKPSECNSKGVISYGHVVSKLFWQNDEFLLKISTFTTAIVSHIIPCILFPIITIILINELRRIDVKRKSSTSSNKAKDSQNRTKLVFYNTILFLIAEFPLGFSMAVTWFFVDVPGLQLIFSYSQYLFSVVLTINTSSHFVICMLMSSQYRNNAKILIFNVELLKNKKVSISSLSQTASSTHCKY